MKIKKHDSLKKRVENMENQLKATISKTIVDFNKIYNRLIESTDDIYKSEINGNDYIPMINEGEYKQASTSVPKRFINFLKLLKMSILNDAISFPRFLIIDTP